MEQGTGESGPARYSDRLLPWRALVILAVLVAVAVRVRLLDVPLERDEGEYAYAGQLILEGVPPYRLAYNMKLPGTYAAYAAIMAVFGQTPRGIHLGLLLVNLATAAVLFRIGKRLVDARTGGVAAAAFSILSLSQAVYGVFAHATHFVVLPALGGALLLLRGMGVGGRDGPGPAGQSEREAEPPKWGILASAGALFGLAFVMKQHGVFFVLFGVAWLAWELWRRRLSGRLIASRCAVLLGGAALPFLLTCAVLWRAGVFEAFWFWTFDYARAYVSEVPLSLGMAIFEQAILGVATPTLPIWALAAAGLAAPLWDRAALARLPFTGGFALASFAAICPGFYFREHYFVLLLPATALLAAIAATAGGRWLRARLAAGPGSPGHGLAEILPALVLLACLGYPVVVERDFFFSMTPREASRRTYGPNPFPEAIEIAARIAADTTPEDRVAVFGSEPEIYFYAHRRSATGHIYMYGMMESQPHARRMQLEAIGQIEAAAPKYIVFVNVPQSWLARPDSDTSILDWSRGWIGAHYELAGLADIVSDETTAYVWGREAIGYRPQSPNVVYILKRV